MLLKKTVLKSKKFPKRFETNLISIYPEIKYQELIGFGGTVTQAAGDCYLKLTEEIKSNFVNDYFSEEGLNYSLVRLPIGNCDFS